MNKIQSMMNGPNGDAIKNAMQEMLAGRKTAAEVMALVNSHPSSGNTGGSGPAEFVIPLLNLPCPAEFVIPLLSPPCLFGLLNPPGFALFVIPLLNPPGLI
jgi:hypothetical protein